MISFETFLHNLQEVKAAMAAACERCGREAATVTLLPVTKTHPAEILDYVKRAGFVRAGENRVQEAVEKAQAKPGMAIELIGHLQTNKVKPAVNYCVRIQSVDSIRLAEKINQAAEVCGKVMPILLQINAGYDPAKFGADVDDADALLECCLKQKQLRVEGLMTIAPLSDDADVAVRTFNNLREIRDRLSMRFSVALPELSMGMSGDMDAAIAAGSTMIRVGTALFGSRE